MSDSGVVLYSKIQRSEHAADLFEKSGFAYTHTFRWHIEDHNFILIE